MVLKEKVILVTGSSRGIGRATALMCAQHHAQVIVNYYKSEKEAFSLLDELKKYKVKGREVQFYRQVIQLQ